MKKLLEMKNVKMSFKEKDALKDINFAINEGEIFGLLGPSGAGKTTIIKIFTGQLKGYRGESRILDVNSLEITDEIYNKIGMVLDNAGLYERLNCYDNLLIFARVYGVKKEKINEVLERVGLINDKETQVQKLSKGMIQRLVLARAILHEPKILFLDEPTSGLDPMTTLKIHRLINELKEKGTTIFLTTHDMVEAAKLCDNIALLNEGIIVEYGKPEEICRKHDLKQSISILLKDGKELSLKNHSDAADEIYSYFKNNLVQVIHSSEPNLEDVFIKLTGRKFEE